MFNSDGEKTWSAELDIYGSVRNFAGRSLSDCPFRYQGQYEDEETGLYYNRFRYYSPDEGRYISQDPIGLIGGIALYGYVHDSNSWIDPLGLSKTPTRTLQQNWLDYVGSKHINSDIHHGFPEEFADRFKNIAGIDVNNPKYYYNLPKGKHTKKPGIHTNSSRTGQNWNKTWAGILDKVEEMNLSKAEAKDFLEARLRELARKERIGKHNAQAVKGSGHH